ncbi:MAG TPA: M20/M25/M40 family metallo-hydrolase [Pirellulales bacterium]
MSSISAADLRRHVEVLANDTFEGREAGSRGGHAAAHYLGREFQKHRLAGGASARSYYQTFGAGYRNILGLLEGGDPQSKRELIVVSAHYDHVGYGNEQNSFGPTGYIHNGADDNASGAAALMELVEAFSQLEPRPARSILFALWDGEEKGLLGSEHWVAHPTWPLAQVRVMINLDMVGRLRQEKIELYGGRTSAGLRRLVSTSNTTANLLFDFSWTMREDSDHYSFYKRGVPVLMFHTGLHGDYHRPSDDVEKLNFTGMQRVTQMLFTLIRQLADEPQLAAFRTAARGESASVQQVRERPLPPLPGRLGVAWDSADERLGRGLRVVHVAAQSAAARAGIRPGDRILKFAGREVRDGKAFRSWVLAAPSPASIAIARGGASQPIELPVQLAGQPLRLGISWRVDDAEPGVVVLSRVVPDSPAAKAGLRVNDRLYEVAGQRFANDAEFRQLVAKPVIDSLELLSERQGRLQTVRLELAVP